MGSIIGVIIALILCMYFFRKILFKKYQNKEDESKEI
jgi:hypothetical protein